MDEDHPGDDHECDHDADSDDDENDDDDGGVDADGDESGDTRHDDGQIWWQTRTHLVRESQLGTMVCGALVATVPSFPWRHLLI